MDFEKLFKSLSYAAVFCGFLSLWVSGTFGVIGTVVFIAIMVAAWFLEGSRWQISERLGTVMIVAALPLYYLLFKVGFFQFADSGTMVAGMLGRLVLSLTAIKILQRKSDRDWIFLYLMAFFEVLLAAGLSISALYLFSFVLYVFVMVSTVIVFEIRKTRRSTEDKFVAVEADDTTQSSPLAGGRVSVTAVVLIFFIICFALPIFFLLPRVGFAGLGSNLGGVSTSSGFSDTVRLGGIGNIQQNDQVVMRVRIETEGADTNGLKWRGVALDTFDNKSWSRKVASKEPRVRTDRDIIQIDFASGRENLTTQTVYLEPLENPILFALPKIVGVQGNFPVLFKDRHGSVSFNRSGERISYKVLSDRALPLPETLREDRAAYPEDVANYLKLPDDLDPRISQLASRLTEDSRNRYDASKKVESYLQNNFGYTLEQKASGEQPLADFLFNVKEGHCEYFATAMAIMLRTEGIATRVVNGFSQGEYNDTADVWVVKQRNAHSWVEVYFPGENAWVPFDPTPFSGQVAEGTSTAGISATIGKYMEALETFWIQYFVAFDNQEQRSLFTSVKRGFQDYQSKTSGWMNGATGKLSDWWADVRGDNGIETSMAAAGRGALYVVAWLVGFFALVWLCRRIVKLKVWRRLRDRFFGREDASIVLFYQRMIEALAEKGFVREAHQTPLEFAYEVGASEALLLTAKYNEVRYGRKNLSDQDEERIQDWLSRIENRS